jgi:hypothetical protein
MVATRPSTAWDRYACVAGIIFVLALVTEAVVAFGVGVNQDDSAAKIANALYVHRERLLVMAYLSVVYAAMFPIYLSRLYNLLRGDTARTRVLGSLVLAGGVLFVALHAVSDVGITGLLGAKLASFGSQHDPGVSYTLYLMTYAAAAGSATGWSYRMMWSRAARTGRRCRQAARPSGAILCRFIAVTGCIGSGRMRMKTFRPACQPGSQGERLSIWSIARPVYPLVTPRRGHVHSHPGSGAHVRKFWRGTWTERRHGTSAL